MRSLVLGCAVLLASTGAFADPAIDVARLRRICAAVLPSATKETDVGCELEFERSGASVRLASQRWQAQLVCILCTPSEVEQTARKLGVMIHAKTTGRAAASLSLPTLGQSAHFRLDGASVAEPFAPLLVTARAHVLVLESAEGRTSAFFEAKPSEKLVAVVESGANKRSVLAWRPRDHVSWSASFIGSGLTLATVGGFLLWQDERCAEALSDASACGDHHELTGAGVAFIAAGALLEAVAIWWLWPRRAKAPTLRVEARP